MAQMTQFTRNYENKEGKKRRVDAKELVDTIYNLT